MEVDIYKPCLSKTASGFLSLFLLIGIISLCLYPFFVTFSLDQLPVSHRVQTMANTAVSLHRNPPFRAEHIGSLLRSDKLLQKRADIDAGKASKSELKAIEDADIKDIVTTQLDLGFHAVTNGEYTRHLFFGTFWEGLEGMEEIHNPDLETVFRTYVPDTAAFIESGFKPPSTVICVGKIKHVGSTYVEEFQYLASLVPKEMVKDVKITLAAPSWYHLRQNEGVAYPKDVYPTEEEYFADIAKAFQTELSILYQAGCRNVQFDDPNLTCTNTRSHQ